MLNDLGLVNIDSLHELAAAATVAEDEDVVPKKFNDAWNHPDEQKRKKWRSAIQKEFTDYTRRGCLDKIPRSKVPVKNKWVFNIKRNGIYRARLVACGYSQVPGQDFVEYYSPVINDTTFKLVLMLLAMHPQWIAKIADTETAFLHGDLDEQIFMNIPEGYDKVIGPASNENECLLLTASIDGLVQAARMYFLKVTKMLRQAGFVGGNVDPCLFYRRNKKGTVVIAIYVDDNLIIGDEKAVDDVIEQMECFGFTLKVTDNMWDYLSCRIVFNGDRSRGVICQPHIYEKLSKEYDHLVKNITYTTPGTPNHYVILERDEAKRLSEEKHAIFRTGVGLLLFLVKHSRPDIANAVRSLSTVVSSPNEHAWKEMLRVIKYALDTKEYGLKLNVKRDNRANGKWELTCYSDGDYAGNPDTRRSISGHVLFLNGIPISFSSKAQKSVTLSSSEAEWIALSEAVKEIVFVVNLLRDINIDVATPIIVNVDNQGAILMAYNANTSARTRHVDIRTKFVREYCSGDDPLIKIVFCMSENNTSDICTKNLAGELHSKHSKQLISKVDWKDETRE